MKKKFDLNIEALRGFCALMVVIHHSIIFSYILDPGYVIREKIISYSPSGHLMVLIFFMLSGYVIGLTSIDTGNFNVLNYFKRRLVRLYPIYVIAILITVFFFAENHSAIVSTVFFLQNLSSNGLIHNNVLWSLNHEVVYYILVVPILIYNLKPSIIISILLFLLIFSLVKLQFWCIVEGYLVGFLFWMTGFGLSKIKLKENCVSTIEPNKLISVFFLLLGCDHLNSFNLNRIFIHLNLLHGTSHNIFDSMVDVTDLSYFPCCLYAVVAAASINPKLYKFLTGFVYVACWSHLIYLVANGSFFKVNIFYIPAFFIVLSTIFRFAPIRLFKSVSLMVSAGSISYAVYVIHMPFLHLIGRVNFLHGGLIAYIFSFLLLITLVLVVGYILEKLYQPRIRNLVIKPSVNINSQIKT